MLEPNVVPNLYENVMSTLYQGEFRTIMYTVIGKQCQENRSTEKHSPGQTIHLPCTSILKTDTLYFMGYNVRNEIVAGNYFDLLGSSLASLPGYALLFSRFVGNSPNSKPPERSFPPTL